MNRRLLIPVLVLCLVLCGCTAREAAPEAMATDQTTTPVTEQTQTGEHDHTKGLHSGLKPDGSFDEATLFIGDSLTFGMVMSYLPDNGYLGEAKYMAIPGAAITCYEKGPALGAKPSAYSPEFEGLFMYQAVEKYGADIHAVYLMLGTNANEYSTDEVYIDMVAHLLEHCPKATIYLQLVPNDQSYKVSSVKANARVQVAYEHFADEARVQLIDTCSAIGYNLAADGIHLVTEGQKCWYEALVNYAKNNGIER